MDNTVIQKYMRSPEAIQRFADLMGRSNANAYVTSVMLVVYSSEDLQQCSPESIFKAATQAAALKLSVDPSVGEAYIIPRRINGKWTATFQPGWKGIYRMAVRTGQYRYINDTRIFEGETLVENRVTGLYSIEGFPTDKTKWHAWLLAFELRSGFAKTFVMTKSELVEHRERYAPRNPKWQTDFDAMAKKTVYRLGLTRYGIFNPYDAQFLQDSDDDVNVGDEVDAADIITVEGIGVPEEPKSEDQLMKELGFEPEPAPAMKDAGGVVFGLIEQIENTPKGEPINMQQATKVYACLQMLAGNKREKLLARLDGKPFRAPKDLEPATVKVLFEFLNPQYDEKRGSFLPSNTIGADALKAEVATW